MLEIFTNPELLIAFFTLTALELVLGIDNIIFISILVDKLPAARRAFARRLGLFLAMFMRIGLLAALSFLAGMTAPLFTLPVLDQGISGRDLILIAGGLFLVWKSVGEVHQLMEGEEGEASSAVKATLSAVLVQIIIIDLVFSLDSIITAIGMVNNLPVMMAAVVASVGLMMFFAGPIGEFVSRHPTVKMLALSFLMVVGVVLVADGLGHHVPKGYIYYAMAFSVVVEMLNLRMKKRAVKPVELHEPYVREAEQQAR
jgi:predicted tellurium resistance membrane protein TerC